MAALRAFRGLRYAAAAGPLGPLLAPASGTLLPAQRDGFAAQDPRNAVHVAMPEGGSDDRSKYIRFARAAARLSEWRREGFLVAEERPVLYRLSQRVGTHPSGDAAVRTTLLAIVDLADGVRSAEASDARIKEDRIRLIEATRTVFEPATAFYSDPRGEIINAIKGAPASTVVTAGEENGGATLETIEDPEAISSIVLAFQSVALHVADGVEGFEASREFRASMSRRDERVPEDGAFLALASFDDASYLRQPIHRVLRRRPSGMSAEALLSRLATRFTVEEHHNRNLSAHIDAASNRGVVTFGLATEGGLGYLLTPNGKIDGPAAVWLHREILTGLLGISERETYLYIADPILAVRTADEGSAGAFLLPRPLQEDLRGDVVVPHRSAQTVPGVPTGLAFWSMGDDV